MLPAPGWQSEQASVDPIPQGRGAQLSPGSLSLKVVDPGPACASGVCLTRSLTHFSFFPPRSGATHW